MYGPRKRLKGYGLRMKKELRLTPMQKFFMERRDKLKITIEKIKKLDMDMKTKTIVLDALDRELLKCYKHI